MEEANYFYSILSCQLLHMKHPLHSPFWLQDLQCQSTSRTRSDPQGTGTGSGTAPGSSLPAKSSYNTWQITTLLGSMRRIPFYDSKKSLKYFQCPFCRGRGCLWLGLPPCTGWHCPWPGSPGGDTHCWLLWPLAHAPSEDTLPFTLVVSDAFSFIIQAIF